MLRRLEELIGCQIGASDGQIGKVKDILFDKQKWGVRHLVVDTGTWLSGNQVLVSPMAVERVDLDEKVIDVNLTRQQIEDAPSIANDLPVSRQYETSYYRHYGWPPYWAGPMTWGYWGAPAMPAVYAPPISSVERELEERRQSQQDAYLHSFKEVNGYKVEASDGSMGDVEDVIIDQHTWKVRYIVVDTSKFLPGKDVLVPPEEVVAITPNDSSIRLDITKEELSNKPEFRSIDELSEREGAGPVRLPRSA